MLLRSLLAFLFVALVSLAPHAVADEAASKKLQALAQQAKENSSLYYDEIFDAQGEVRPHYRDVLPLYLKKTEDELAAIRKGTLKDFRGDNALSAMPRIMTQSEYNQLKLGVEQRGKALLLFLQDYYSGEKSYAKANLIPEDVLQRIVNRSGEAGYRGQLKPELIRFMYGPDVIRDADGVFRVLEDNTNFLGGQGDLVMARQSLFKHMPEMQTALEKDAVAQPINFYRDLLARYRSEMKNPGDRIVVFSVPPYPDNEDYRLKAIWDELGVDWVTPTNGKKRLTKKKDGMYLEWFEGKRLKSQRVGYMIFNSEFQYADPNFPAAKQQWLLKEATERLGLDGAEGFLPEQKIGMLRAMQPDPKTGLPDFKKMENIMRLNPNFTKGLEKGVLPGLLEAITSGQLLVNNSPGTEFINDKEFNIYVEDLIKFYLKEDPILRNLPSAKLYRVGTSGARVVDEAVLKELEGNWDKYVVKVVDGRGGDGVWVGPKLSAEERLELVKKLRADPSREVIIQSYRHPSVLAGDIVDARLLSQVGPSAAGERGGKVYVSDTAWTRGVGMAGDGKVNLSAGTAHEVTFVVVKDSHGAAAADHLPAAHAPLPKDCARLFSQ